MVILEILIIGAIIITSITLHEFAHGMVAYRCGDQTAKLAGRLSMNPLRHIDPVGTVLLPGILIALKIFGYPTIVFGWAKPVPINFLNFRNPKRDLIWVAVAGPGANLALAVFFSLLMKMDLPAVLIEYLSLAVFLNLLLAIFNSIPIPPLDGSRIVMGILPNNYARLYGRLEKYGFPIIIILFFFGFFSKAIFPIITVFGKILGVEF